MSDPSSDGHLVELIVGESALRVDVWDKYDLNLSMVGAGNPWTFSFWHSDTAHSDWALLTGPQGPKCGDPVRLAIDGDTVLAGYVEVLEAGDDDTGAGGRGGVSVVISGRDSAGPAIGFDADPTLTMRGVPLQDALTQLFTGVGLVVDVSQHIDPATRTGTLRVPHSAHARKASRHQQLDLAKPHVGEKVWQVAERVVRRLGYRLWVAPGGTSGHTALVVDVPNTTGDVLWTFTRALAPDGTVTPDSNILRGRRHTSIREVPTAVTVYSDAMRGDNASARMARTVMNTRLNDLAITRGEVRPFTFSQPRYVRSELARTNDAAQREGERQIAEAMETFRTVRLTVQGHGQRGAIYAPNTRASVRDDVTGVRETMLLVDITLSGGRSSGQHSRLTLCPEGALTTTPVPA